MDRVDERLARHVGGALALVTGGVVAVFVVVFALHRLVAVPELKEFVDIGGEANLPTWWNASLLLAAALSAGLAAAVDAHRARRRAWSVVGLAATYLSLDEVASLHERLSGPVRAAGFDVPTYAWLVPGVVLALVGSVVLVLVTRPLPAPTRRLLALSLALYGGGAVVLEAVNGLLRDQGLRLLFSVGTTLEETLEMIACIGVVVAALRAAAAARPAPVSTWQPEQGTGW